MFDVNVCEKEIAMAILKREAGVKDLSLEEVAAKIGMTDDAMDCVVSNRGKYYLVDTILFWAKMIADDCTSDYLHDQKKLRKMSYPPCDKFYFKLWQYMCKPDKKKEESSELQNKD